jgi:nucleotide-binding universal stress UspA family protein
MKTQPTILVTTDFSDASNEVFGLARQMAEKFDAKLIVLHAHHMEVPPLVIEGMGMTVVQIHDDHRKKSLAKLKDLVRLEELNAEAVVVDGAPHREIVRYAKEHAIDMIIMASHGYGFFTRAIMGSTTERVIRHAHCPVLVYRGEPVNS